jgi:GTPase SAR1 family protein
MANGISRVPGRVGKTSILLRYIRGEYDDKQVSTLQASYLDKKITVDNKVRSDRIHC